MATKSKNQLASQIGSIQATISELPVGGQRAALENLITKLQLTADAVLLDNGNVNPDAAKLIPQRGLFKSPLADGDGHALVCC
jgi:hypothetical protein